MVVRRALHDLVVGMIGPIPRHDLTTWFWNLTKSEGNKELQPHTHIQPAVSSAIHSQYFNRYAVPSAID